MPTVFPTGTYGHMIVNTSGIVHYMRMNDTSGSGDDVNSLSGTGTNVTYQQPGALAGDPNKSVYFSGSNSYMNYGNTNSLVGPFTIEVWIYPTQDYTSGFPTFLSKENYNTPYSGWSFYLEGRTSANGGMRAVFARMNGGVNYVTSRIYSTRVYANQWTYLVATYDNSTLRMYRNGVYEWDTPSSGGMNTSAYSFLMGAATNASSTYYSDFYKGNVDELAIYNRALSQTEITNHYNRGITPPVQYYSLSDSRKISSTEARSVSATVSLSELPKIKRTEAYTQNGFVSLSDTGLIVPAESSDILTAFGGTLLSVSDARTVGSTEARTITSTVALTDNDSNLRATEQTAVAAATSLSDPRTISATENILVEKVVRANIAYPQTVRRQSGFVHFIVSKYVHVPFMIQYKFNDVVPIEATLLTEFVVLDQTYNPIAVGWVTTRWSTTPYPIIVDVSLEVDGYPDLLEEFGLPRKQQD